MSPIFSYRVEELLALLTFEQAYLKKFSEKRAFCCLLVALWLDRKVKNEGAAAWRVASTSQTRVSASLPIEDCRQWNPWSILS
jgi:hypothetical protein